MVIGDFLVIKDFFRFRKFGAQKRSHLREVVFYSRQRTRHFGVDIIAQVGRIHTGISGQSLLIKGLDELERLLRRKGVFLIAIDLQRSQVIEFRSELRTFLFLH